MSKIQNLSNNPKFYSHTIFQSWTIPFFFSATITTNQ